MKKSALLASMLLVTISPCALAVETGFYAGANVLGIRQEAKKWEILGFPVMKL